MSLRIILQDKGRRDIQQSAKCASYTQFDRITKKLRLWNLQGSGAAVCCAKPSAVLTPSVAIPLGRDIFVWWDNTLGTSTSVFTVINIILQQERMICPRKCCVNENYCFIILIFYSQLSPYQYQLYSVTNSMGHKIINRCLKFIFGFNGQNPKLYAFILLGPTDLSP